MALKKTGILLGFFFCMLHGYSQNKAIFLVKDAESGEPLSNIAIVARGDAMHSVTNSEGKASVLIPYTRLEIIFSGAGYRSQSVDFNFSSQKQDSVFSVLMYKEEKSDAIIYSTRSHSEIINTPVKVELLRTEKMEAETGIKPSHISGLLGEVAGIQSQQVSAVSGNIEMRIRELPGNYSQLLRDGMPVYNGFANSFSILQNLPLEVKQIEIIKEPASGLYGNGSIAGIINIISKKPKPGQPERSLLLNQTTLQESNLQIYLSERKGKTGYTFLVGANYQKQKDINNDGFSDVGRKEAALIHPTFFFYPNEKNTVSLSITSSYEDRLGGDMEILAGYYSNFHQFFIQNQTFRNTLDLVWENEINSRNRLTWKATTSNFSRDISSHVFGMKAKQLTYLTEASYVKKTEMHDLVAGLSVFGENFTKRLPDSTLLQNYRYFTPGLFVQDDWRIHSHITIQPALRSDFHNRYGTFILPRITLLYKINPALHMRISGATGYKTPSVVDNKVDERDYPALQPLQQVKAERSSGINWSLDFKKKFGRLSLAISQSLFYTRVRHPLVMQRSANSISFFNAAKPITTTGLETWMQLNLAGLETNIGYSITDARRKYNPAQPYLEYSAREKWTGTLSWKISKNFRMMMEATKTGKQYLEDGSRGPSYTLVAGMLQVNAGRVIIVLNCENIFDYRQTKNESIVIPPYLNPSFKMLWAPIDGRVANLSVRIKF